MNKTTIPLALVGIAASVAVLAGCGSDDNSTVAKGYSEGADAVSAAQATADASKDIAKMSDPVDNAYSQTVTIGGTIDNLDISYHLDSLKKVDNPAPECPGPYYALTMTGTNLDRHNYADPKDVPNVYSYDIDRHEIYYTNDTDKSGEALPDPNLCSVSDTRSWEQRRVLPNDTFTVTTYTRIRAERKPVVLRIDSHSTYIKIPADLR